MVGSPPPSDFGDGAPLVRTGEVVSGKFRIERVLGQGGMGVVVAAKHLQLDETVALKFLRAHASSDPDALARFTREARAAAS
jgi:serine/threonine protein kinase